MKTIVIGASLSGKTTLVQHLQSKNIHCSEMDEELTLLNGGSYPTDVEHKHNDLVPKVVEDILKKSDILFFSNTDYFTLENLRQAKANGFKIYQLDINLVELKKRNLERVEQQHYEDMSPWLEDMVDYQNALKSSGLVDKTIDATLPVEKVAKEIL